jgi:hypothetical protein
MQIGRTHRTFEEDRQLLIWNEDAGVGFGSRPVVAAHRVNSAKLFSDSALADLFETQPRDQLQGFTMGTDFTNQYEWQPVDTTGVSGKDLLAAVARGRLWFHFFRIQDFHPTYGAVLKQLVAELRDVCPGFHPVKWNATLLVSSPNALVYYHADPQPNVLWHFRGSKRVWVYPAGDDELIDQELMENIFASYTDEEIPYRPEFDRKASVFDVTPGGVLTWPQNAPHRVANMGDLNVTISTFYETAESDRRKLLYCSNRWLRRSLHIPAWSTKESGIGSYIKRFTYRGLRKAGLLKPQPPRAYITQLVADPSAPNGCSRMDGGPVLTEFSRISSQTFSCQRARTEEF